MSVTEIIEAVKDLSPNERERVAEALRGTLDEDDVRSVEERQHELNAQLVKEGRLRLPDPDRNAKDLKPIKIKGEPLSETIIRERR